MKWSFTELDKYEACQRKWYLDKIYPEKFKKIVHFAIGEAVHKFIEFYSMNHDATLQQCKAMFAASMKKSKHFRTEKDIEDNIYMVEQYYEKQKPMTPLKINNAPAIEIYFKVNLCSKTILSGKIDMITTKVSVVDHKTSKEAYTKDDVRNILVGKGFQLGCYGIGAYDLIKEIPRKVGFSVLIKDPTTNNLVIQNIGRSIKESELNAVKNKVCAIDEEATKKYGKVLNFSKSTHSIDGTYNCLFCKHKNIC